MYYITNQEKQIVAADSDFLSLLEIESLQELMKQMAKETIEFNEKEDGSLDIHLHSKVLTLSQKRHTLTTVMGELLLFEVSPVGERSETGTVLNLDTEIGEKAAETLISLPETEEGTGFTEVKKESLEAPAESTEAEEETADEDLIQLIVPEETEEEEEAFLKSESDEEAVTLPEPENETDFIKSEEEYPVEEEEENTVNLLPDEKISTLQPQEAISELPEEPIRVDAVAISKILGISKEDYSDFLNQFIDQAIEEEEAVKNPEHPEHQKALSSLYKLSEMLHISPLSKILKEASDKSGEEESKAIEHFYHTLSGMTAFSGNEEVATLEPSEAEEESAYENEICDLVLDSVKPIHFDFQTTQASEELGLPLELIVEFIHDFIAQAHAENETFYTACKKGDIDTIHKTAHRLKGVASNLRIVPLAETLEELQFSEDTSRFEPLLKKYWGQLIALEQFMDVSSNTKEGK